MQAYIQYVYETLACVQADETSVVEKRDKIVNILSEIICQVYNGAKSRGKYKLQAHSVFFNFPF